MGSVDFETFMAWWGLGTVIFVILVVYCSYLCAKGGNNFSDLIS